MDVREQMAIGAARYADALAELGRYGPAAFTQTGGMCAALEVRLERGYLLITDVDDSLPWNPEDLRGWGVGFYPSDDVSDGPDVFIDHDDPTAGSLGPVVEQCLTEVRDVMKGHPERR